MDPSKLPRAKPHLPVAVVAPTVRKEPKAKSRQMNDHVTANTSQDRSSELAQGRQGNYREPQQELQNVSRATGQTRPLQEGDFPEAQSTTSGLIERRREMTSSNNSRRRRRDRSSASRLMGRETYSFEGLKGKQVIPKTMRR